MMLLPSMRNKVAGELNKVTLELEEKVRLFAVPPLLAFAG